MVPSLSLIGIFQQVFGRTPEQFELEPITQQESSNAVGSPYFANDHLGRQYFMPVKLGGVQLPAPVIMVELAPVRYALHSMIHRSGDAKGLINQGDHRIWIRGICYDVNDRYPEELVDSIVELYDRKVALDIDNALVTKLKPVVQQVVFISPPRITPRPGFPGQVLYELELLSDSPFTLTVTPKN